MVDRKEQYGGLDRFRLIAAFLVVAVHTSPFAVMGDNADFFFSRVLARIAVPFFFMVSGQFAGERILCGPSGSRSRALRTWFVKMAKWYGMAILLYLPLGIYAGYYRGITVTKWLRMLLFDGTFYHLWYIPACMLGMTLLYGLGRRLSLRGITAVSIVLYLIGLLGDSYYGLTAGTKWLGMIYDGMFSIFGYTRNGIFMAPVFLVMGVWCGRNREKISGGMAGMGLAMSFLLMTGEAFWLRKRGFMRHDSMYVMLIPVMLFLYQLLIGKRCPPHAGWRKVSEYVYLFHPWMIVLVRGLAKQMGLTAVLVENSMFFYLAVCGSSLLLAEAILLAKTVWKREDR